MAITLSNVSKQYGKQKALNQISFDLKEGEICGFLGPNGAGKSTTMKIITGCLTDFEGEVNICGIDIHRHPLEAKKLVGYLPEHNPLYPDLYIREYLLHIARLYHIHNPHQQVEQIIGLTGLAPEIHKKIGQLSKGYRQRVGLAQALVHNPQVLILDEPMTGLDPNQLEEIRNLISETGKNKTILLSTHIMQEVEAICERVMIINQGQIVADKSLDEIRSLSGRGIYIQVRFAPDTNTQWLAAHHLFEKTTQLTPDNWLLHAKADTDPRIELFQQAVHHNCPIIELKTEEQNLESIFREITHTPIPSSSR